MELKNQTQLAGHTIHLRRCANKRWKAILPAWGIPFEPTSTGEGETVIEALRQLTDKLVNVPNND